MNVPAVVPCAVAAGAAASAGGTKQSVADTLRSVPGFLFPLLLGDLLQAEPENPGIEKKQEDSFPGADGTALVPVPVPLPTPAGFFLAAITSRISSAPSGAESHTSTDLEPASGTSEFGAPKGKATDANGLPGLVQVSNQVAAAPSGLLSPGDAAEAALPAGFVVEPSPAEPTVASPACPASMPATPVIPRALMQEVSEPLETGIAPLRQPAPQTNTESAPAAAQPRTPPVLSAAATGWISPALSAIAALASAHGSTTPALAAGSKRVARIAVPPAPSERADLGMQPAGKADLAFTARLSPLDKPAAPRLTVPVPGKFMAPPPEAPAPVPSRPPAELDANSARRETPASGSVVAPRTAAHPGSGAAPDTDSPVRNAESLLLANDARVAEVPPAAFSPRPHAALVAELHRAASGAPPEPGLSLSAPAREIRLQVNEGEQRVDVRLTEHRGEVQVAVRTPDSRLTEALRSDLPALSARLEQNGFRAETWHPAASRPEHAVLAPEPASSGSAPQGHGDQQHGKPQDHEPPRRVPLPEDRSDSPPPEFSWLLSSLR